MAQGFNAADFQRKLRTQQRRAQSEVDRVNRENKRRVDEHNRKAQQRNQRVQQEQKRQVDAYNRGVDKVNEHNRKANQHNREVITKFNENLRSSPPALRYTEAERTLADRVKQQASLFPNREYDVFLSYARIDGSAVGTQLQQELKALGVQVWFDELAIVPGKSQSRQMDHGLRLARAGIALLTPAYLAGRFWTERELGVLLGKQTLIPVLHQVAFSEVAEYSGFLPDLAGFETERDSIEVIAAKIAEAVLLPQSESL